MANIDFSGNGIASTFAAGTPKMTVKVTGSGIASTVAFGNLRVAPVSNLVGGAVGTTTTPTTANKTSSAASNTANSKSTFSVG